VLFTRDANADSSEFWALLPADGVNPVTRVTRVAHKTATRAGGFPRRAFRAREGRLGYWSSQLTGATVGTASFTQMSLPGPPLRTLSPRPP
jgi:hypothetical protein